MKLAAMKARKGAAGDDEIGNPVSSMAENLY